MEMNETMIADERINQNFYCINENFSYFLRSEVVLQDIVEPQILGKAVETAFLRFPYFSATLCKDEHGYYAAPNNAPPVILQDDSKVILNSPEVNGHLIVVSCHEDRIVFSICHCITDGRGILPFIKTVLYYYLTGRYGMELDSSGICLTDTPEFPDENEVPENPVPVGAETAAANACAAGTENTAGGKAGSANAGTAGAWKAPGGSLTGTGALKGEIFRLAQSPHVTDQTRMEYRFTVDETAFMEACRANKTSPNALVSTLLARAVWNEAPQLTENVAINLCVDMRTALQCPHYHMNMTTCVPLVFEASLKDSSLPENCAAARKSMTDGAQGELMRDTYEKSIVQAGKIRRIKKEEMKQKIMYSHLHGPGGFFYCTVLLSYWGPDSFDSLAPYVNGIFTTIDFIPEGGMAVEILCGGGKFCFSMMQDFSSDIYVKQFIHLLEELGLTVENETRMPMPAVGIALPQ